jgi:hypothetical protein
MKTTRFLFVLLFAVTLLGSFANCIPAISAPVLVSQINPDSSFPSTTTGYWHHHHHRRHHHHSGVIIHL